MEKCLHVYYLVVFLILAGSTSSEGQKVLLFLLIFQSVACILGCLYFISLVGLARFQLCRVLESQFFMS